MIPIRDTIHSRSFPIVNWLIIIFNVLVFFIQANLPVSRLEGFIGTYALVPSSVDLGNPLSWYPFFTHFWLHASLWHLISNVWILYIFGDNVEDRLGSFRYLLFYVLGGISAGLLQYFFSVGSVIPILGASGAIAAVMGAYFLFFPNSRVVTLVPIFFFGWFINVRSIVYIGIWFITQVFSGITSLGMPGSMEVGGVAWWAHIGGFLFGLLLAKPFTIGKPKRRKYADEYYPW